MRLQSLFGGVGITKVPYEDEWVLVRGNSSNEPRRDVGIPSYCAHRLSSVIVQGEVLLLSLHIPNRNKTAAASGRQDVPNLLVPIQGCVLVGVGASLAQAEGLGLIVEIVNIELAVCAGRGEGVGPDGVELDRLDWARVFVNLFNEGVASNTQYSSPRIEQGMFPNLAPARSFSASHSTRAPLSSAPAIIPRGYSSLG